MRETESKAKTEECYAMGLLTDYQKFYREKEEKKRPKQNTQSCTVAHFFLEILVFQ